MALALATIAVCRPYVSAKLSRWRCHWAILERIIFSNVILQSFSLYKRPVPLSAFILRTRQGEGYD